MRCLPSNKIPLAQGRCLHDWHAEIVAIRAFNHYLLRECNRLVSSKASYSYTVRFRDAAEKTPTEYQAFALRDDVKIRMFSTEAPCGDATMELTMRAQNDASPWVSESRSAIDGLLQSGRGHFSELGVIRRKPARADAPPTLSKSCSDKLALKQCTSLLSSVTSLLIHPANVYLDELVLPREQVIQSSIERAFASTGRLAVLEQSSDHSEVWSGGYTFRAFRVTAHTFEFEYAKPITTKGNVTKGSNVAAVWTPDLFEILIGGTKQGHRQFSMSGASGISRWSLWSATNNLAENADLSAVLQAFDTTVPYAQVKDHDLLNYRQLVKSHVKQEALKTWTPNVGDEQFYLEDKSQIR